MKILYTIPAMFILSGCFYQDVPKFIIDKSEQICAEHGGVWEITSYPVGRYSTICGDGFGIDVGGFK